MFVRKLSESFKIKDFEAQPNFVWRGLNKFAPCSGLRRRIIDASLSRACELASQTPHNVAKDGE
jgi:hypothetical protein